MLSPYGRTDTMPLYLFRVQNDPNDTGDACELENVGAAKCHAVKMAGQMICDQAGTFWDTREFGMTVTDKTGLTLFTLNFLGTDAPVLLDARG